MAFALEDFTVRVHLAQLALSIGFVAPVNRQIVYRKAKAGTNAEAEFGQGWSVHE